TAPTSYSPSAICSASGPMAHRKLPDPMTVPVSPKRTALLALSRERILVLDGAMGTMIQGLQYDETAFRGERFKDFHRDLRGNNDLLILTQPKAIEHIHADYLRAGADIVATNTFSSTSIAQADYDLSGFAYELNFEGAKLARAAAERVAADGKPRFVAGAIGPTNRTASISPDVSSPGFRAVTFDDLPNAFGQYDESPEYMARLIGEFATSGLVNIVGGCCGTTPDHIAAIAAAVAPHRPRAVPVIEPRLRLSGLEPFELTPAIPFVNVGERTNVTGSARFRKLITAGDYNAALQVARDLVENGAKIIDGNIDEGMLDSA